MQSFKDNKHIISKEEATPVLLICIYNKNSLLLAHNIFYCLFSRYGIVEKILIFEKAKLWKAFVQMDSKDSAIRV